MGAVEAYLELGFRKYLRDLGLGVQSLVNLRIRKFVSSPTIRKRSSDCRAMTGNCGVCAHRNIAQRDERVLPYEEVRQTNQFLQRAMIIERESENSFEETM